LLWCFGLNPDSILLTRIFGYNCPLGMFGRNLIKRGVVLWKQ